jgi:hypothetical protein
MAKYPLRVVNLDVEGFIRNHKVGFDLETFVSLTRLRVTVSETPKKTDIVGKEVYIKLAKAGTKRGLVHLGATRPGPTWDPK